MANLEFHHSGDRTDDVARHIVAALEAAQLGHLAGRLDEEAHCVLLESASERFFSAGADVAVFQRSSVRRRAMTVLIAHEVFRKLEQSPLLFIAVITGHCLGGGFEWALACDLRFASRGEYRLGLPETSLGLLPELKRRDRARDEL